MDAAGKLTYTVDADTTRYIDLNDPANPATSGDNAGKNPQGIVDQPARAPAPTSSNFVSRNVSVVDLTNDSVVTVIRTAPLPAPGSPQEVVTVGAEMFFSSRGNFNRPAGSDRLDDRAAVERGLAELLELPLRGPHRQRRVGVRHRPAQVGAAERELQPAQPRTSSGSSTTRRSSTRSRTSRPTSATSPVPAPLAAPLPCSAPPPADQHARPQPRPADRRQRRHQPRARA